MVIVEKFGVLQSSLFIIIKKVCSKISISISHLNFTNTFFRISISEISFDSRPASGSHVAESAPTTEDASADSYQPTTVAFSESPREKMNADAEGSFCTRNTRLRENA